MNKLEGGLEGKNIDSLRQANNQGCLKGLQVLHESLFRLLVTMHGYLVLCALFRE